jgi:hypothetical protein
MKINWGKIESVLADIFKFGTAAAAVAEPIVNATNPGISGVYDISVNAAMTAEEAAEEAATKETTDAAKVAAIADAVTPVLAQATTAAGVSPHTADQIAAYSKSVVTGLHILSAIDPASTTT